MSMAVKRTHQLAIFHPKRKNAIRYTSSDTRHFAGLLFHRDMNTASKIQANKRAKIIRAGGKLARVVASRGGWAVYSWGGQRYYR